MSSGFCVPKIIKIGLFLTELYKDNVMVAFCRWTVKPSNCIISICCEFVAQFFPIVVQQFTKL